MVSRVSGAGGWPVLGGDHIDDDISTKRRD